MHPKWRQESSKKKGTIICFHQNTWVMDLLATSSSMLPMLTCTGSLSKSPAIFVTSLGQVAVYIRVCLVRGISSTIFRICGSKPMSSIRSASSSTSNETWWRLIFFISRISLRRPGVATTISAPRSSSLSWGPFEAPPYRHWEKCTNGNIQCKDCEIGNIVLELMHIFNKAII